LKNDFLAIEKTLFKKQITLVQKIPAGNNLITLFSTAHILVCWILHNC